MLTATQKCVAATAYLMAIQVVYCDSHNHSHPENETIHLTTASTLGLNNQISSGTTPTTASTTTTTPYNANMTSSATYATVTAYLPVTPSQRTPEGDSEDNGRDLMTSILAPVILLLLFAACMGMGYWQYRLAKRRAEARISAEEPLTGLYDYGYDMHNAVMATSMVNFRM